MSEHLRHGLAVLFEPAKTITKSMFFPWRVFRQAKLKDAAKSVTNAFIWFFVFQTSAFALFNKEIRDLAINIRAYGQAWQVDFPLLSEVISFLKMAILIVVILLPLSKFQKHLQGEAERSEAISIALLLVINVVGWYFLIVVGISFLLVFNPGIHQNLWLYDYALTTILLPVVAMVIIYLFWRNISLAFPGSPFEARAKLVISLAVWLVFAQIIFFILNSLFGI